MRKNSIVSLIAVVVAGLLWGSMSIFVRGLNALGLETFGIVSIRCFITFFLLAIYLGIFKRDKLKIRLKDIWCFVGSGMCSIIFFNYCYFKTITMTSASVAAVLLYTSPAFIMVMSRYLFKEKFTRLKFISLALTFGGCFLVSGIVDRVTGGGVGISGAAILLGLGSGFGYALYSIFGRFALDRGYSSITITFYTFMFASLGCLFVGDLGQEIAVITGSFKGMLLCIGIAVAITLIPYTLYTYGLAGMDNGTAGVVVSIEPAMATIISLFVFREKMSLIGGVGVIMVLIAIIIVNFDKEQQ